MLDGNTAALRSHEQRQYYVDGVFARHEADARQDLADEACEKITADQVTLDDVWDELLGDRRQPELELALAHDLDMEVGRLLRGVRDEIVAKRRVKYVKDNIEQRVWDMENGE